MTYPLSDFLQALESCHTPYGQDSNSFSCKGHTELLLNITFFLRVRSNILIPPAIREQILTPVFGEGIFTYKCEHRKY